MYVKGINLSMHEIYLAHMTYVHHAKYTPLHLLQNGFVCKKNDATMFSNKSNCTKATLDVLLGQPIKLAQVAFTSELLEKSTE